MSDSSIITIEAGRFYEGDVTGDTIVSFTSDEPVMVIQYMKGHSVNKPPRGDPSMLLAPPFSTFSNHVTFPAFQYLFKRSMHTYFINLIVKCNNVDGLIFDETKVTDWDTIKTDDNSTCCVRGEVSAGLHTVSHVSPLAKFAVLVYAICDTCQSSYAYPAKAYYSHGKCRPIKEVKGEICLSRHFSITH